jgi:hypothetical protein
VKTSYIEVRQECSIDTLITVIDLFFGGEGSGKNQDQKLEGRIGGEDER